MYLKFRQITWSLKSVFFCLGKNLYLFLTYIPHSVFDDLRLDVYSLLSYTSHSPFAIFKLSRQSRQMRRISKELFNPIPSFPFCNTTRLLGTKLLVSMYVHSIIFHTRDSARGQHDIYSRVGIITLWHTRPQPHPESCRRTDRQSWLNS